MGPIRVLYGQKSLYGAQVGPKWDKCPDSAHMVPIYTCLLVKVYQYGTYIGLIWAKKAYMGPCHSTVILVILFCSNRQMMLPDAGPEWDKCPDSAHMGPICTVMYFDAHLI